MKGKNIMSLSLILMFPTVIMMNMQPVKAPSTYEYELYVDGFDWSIVSGWTYYGTDPWLDATNDGNYIESSEYCGLMGFFTFEDINLAPCQVITKVVLEGYTRSSDLEIEGDVFTPDWEWVGSLWGTSTWDWHTPRYHPVLSDVVQDTLTVTGLNNFKALLHYWTPTHVSYGPFEVDSLRLKVYTAISATIDIDPDVVKLDNNAQFLTCYIEPCTGFSATDIDPSTVELDGIPALPSPWGIGDNIPQFGVDDLMVKFDGDTVKKYIVDVLLNGNPPDPGETVYVTLTITGLISGDSFAGRCTIGVKG